MEADPHSLSFMGTSAAGESKWKEHEPNRHYAGGPPEISPLEKIRALLLAEMVARVIKNLARKKMRRLFRKLKLPSGLFEIDSGAHGRDISLRFLL